MSKQAVRWLYLLSAICIVAILAMGCSSAIQPTVSATAELSSPTPTPGSENADILHTQTSEENPTDAVKASSTPNPSSDSNITQSSPKASASAKASSTAAPTNGDSSQTSASSQPPSAVTVKPSATVKPSPTIKPSPTVKPVASPAASSTVPSVDSNEKVTTATLTIIGDNEFGIILAATAVEVENGDSVMDILKRITRKHKIQMEFKGIGSGAYVEGIDNLYEFDQGAESGWMYRVNGDFPNIGPGGYDVAPGDRIEWLYTLNLGKDVGAKTP